MLMLMLMLTLAFEAMLTLLCFALLCSCSALLCYIHMLKPKRQAWPALLHGSVVDLVVCMIVGESGCTRRQRELICR